MVDESEPFSPLATAGSVVVRVWTVSESVQNVWSNVVAIREAAVRLVSACGYT